MILGFWLRVSDWIIKFQLVIPFFTQQLKFYKEADRVIRLLHQYGLPTVANFDAKNPDPASSHAPYRIFNIGNSRPLPLMHFIETLEDALGKKAIKKMMDMQAGDVKETSADTSELNRWVKFKPNTSIKEGVKRFVDWYKIYY